MQAAVEIFLNGVFGVFMGLSILYIAIKINKLLGSREIDNKEQ